MLFREYIDNYISNYLANENYSILYYNNIIYDDLNNPLLNTVKGVHFMTTIRGNKKEKIFITKLNKKIYNFTIYDNKENEVFKSNHLDKLLEYYKENI